MHSWVRVVFVCCAKRREKKTKNKNWNFAHLYLGNGWRDLLRFLNVASPYRLALSQQILCSSDKRWRIYECVKIATLLFLLIYLLLFARAPFSWAVRHTTVCLDSIFTSICTRPVFLGHTTHGILLEIAWRVCKMS